MDAFFAAVEQQHKPSLRGRPVIVGGVGLRGVVSTASYEARVFGVRSAMPTAVARRLCPHAAYLYPRFGAYHAVSQVVMGALREVSPLVEPVSLDEAFVDLAAAPDGAPSDIDDVRRTAERLRAEICRLTGLTVSVGAGTSKLVAKVASDADKPNGCVIVAAGTEQNWLDPLPVRALWGVGPATAERLRRIGVATVADLRALSEADLVGLLGVAWGALLYRLARGLDGRAVEPERVTKSISVEDTYPRDLVDPARLRSEIAELAGRVVRRMRDAGFTARTVTLKARGHDFTTVTRAETLRAPTDDLRVVAAAALRLLAQAVPAATASASGIRLLGVGVSGLSDFAQGDLLAELQTGDGEHGSTSARRSPLADVAAGTPSVSANADDGDAASQLPAVTLFGPVPVEPGLRRWLPGQDVYHTRRGPGWVQGAGVGRVTVRFEGPDTPPGRIGTFPVADPDLAPVDSAQVARAALAARAGG